MAIPISLPDSLRPFLDEEMRERGQESLVHRFMAFFAGFLEGCFESLAIWWKDRFLLAVESNRILYGFDGEQFFTREFESSEEFEKTRAALAERLPKPGFYTPD